MTPVNRKLLTVGITGYTPKLLGPAADARAIADVLHRRGRFPETPPLARHHHDNLDLRWALEAFCDRLGPADLAVIFFAGHAALDSAGRLRLLPRDITDADYGLRVDHLLRDASKAGFALFVFDCCHAAGAIEPALDMPRGGAIEVIAACQPTSTARTEGAHGVLTRGILDAIANGYTEVGAIVAQARAHCVAQGQAPASFSHYPTGATIHLVDPPVDPPPPPTDDPIAAWRRLLCTAHDRLLPFVSRRGSAALSTHDAVQLDVAPCGGAFGPDARHRLGPRSLTLRQLMALERRDPDTANRWAILGDPGAGKSTLARHLAWTLGADPAPDAPVPVFMSVDRLLTANAHPFAIAADDLEAACDAATGAALEKRLRALAELPDRVWLLLDGLDEVPRPRVQRAIARIRGLADELPQVTLAVLSRPVGYPEDALRDRLAPARVQALDPARQRSLLDAWLGADGADGVLRRIHAQRRLLPLAQNPLMLTLLARLALPALDADGGAEAAELPDSRAELYDQTIELLLERGHGPESTGGVKDPSAARPLLEAVSLILTDGGGAAWDLPALSKAVWQARRADAHVNFVTGETWGSVVDALRDIGHNSGVLAPHDGPNERWRYLHRSLKERLAADAIFAAGPDALAARLDALIERAGGEDDADPLGQWGETLGMACGLLGDARAALETLRAASPKLAVRVLLDAEALPLGEALDFLGTIDPYAEQKDPWHPLLWDGDTVLALALGCRGAAEVLWARVTPATELEHLAWLHYALAAIEGAVDRAQFFRACDRWPVGGPPEPELVDIPAGRIRMGTSAIERATLSAEWHERIEKYEAAHWVTLTAGYQLGECPVTVAEYRRFDPEHTCPGGPKHPVTEVSWWRARLYAAWVGCALPTEAQWERACRAGSETSYWSGDNETDLKRVGWYGKGPSGSAHPVGQKPANPLGLYDLHGNVLEWCADWFEAYPAGPAEDPLGPPTGEHRVLRGGSFWLLAVDCRSADRSWSVPGYRRGDFGFRLARPAPDA